MFVGREAKSRWPVALSSQPLRTLPTNGLVAYRISLSTITTTTSSLFFANYDGGRSSLVQLDYARAWCSSTTLNTTSGGSSLVQLDFDDYHGSWWSLRKAARLGGLRQAAREEESAIVYRERIMYYKSGEDLYYSNMRVEKDGEVFQVASHHIFETRRETDRTTIYIYICTHRFLHVLQRAF